MYVSSYSLQRLKKCSLKIFIYLFIGVLCLIPEYFTCTAAANIIVGGNWAVPGRDPCKCNGAYRGWI